MGKPHALGDFLYRADGVTEDEMKQLLKLKVESDMTDIGVNVDDYNFEYVIKDETVGYKGTLKEEYR